MKVTAVWSGLTAAALVLVAGTALSGRTATNAAQLVEYDETNEQLWAYPVGQPLTAYLNRNATQYLAADLKSYEPPDPCIAFATAWNFTVAYDTERHVQSRGVFAVLLGVMSRFQCRATVTSLVSGSPEPLVTITPTP